MPRESEPMNAAIHNMRMSMPMPEPGFGVRAW